MKRRCYNETTPRCETPHTRVGRSRDTGREEDKVSILLERLEGRIDDQDYSDKADLETRVVLQRHLLKRLSARSAAADAGPQIAAD